MPRCMFVKRTQYNLMKQRILQILGLFFIILIMFVNFGKNETNTVNIYGWYGIFPPEIMKQFEDETGIKVVYDSFDNNNILETKLLSGSSGYDLVFPSFIPYASREVLMKVFSKIDYSLIPNVASIKGTLTQKFREAGGDTNYLVPIFWGTMGIVYNADIINKEFPDLNEVSYNELFDARFMKKVSKYGIAFPEEYIDMFPQVKAYLKIHGHNVTGDKDAMPVLASIRKYITKFNSTTTMFDMASAEICLSICSSDIAFKTINAGKSVGKNMKYSVTPGMTPAWIDCVAIPATAPHKKNAHKFINFILRPEIALQITNYSGILINIPQNYSQIDEDMQAIPNIVPNVEDIDGFILGDPITGKEELERERQSTDLWSKVKIGIFKN